MALGVGDSAGLLFRIRGDASDAVRAFTETKAAETELTTTTGATASAFSGLAGPISATVGVLTVLGVAAGGAAAALLSLAKDAANYGSEIHDAAQRTGQSVENIQALKFAAEQSGSSFEAISGSVAKFSALVGEAKNGNEKAIATLKQYHIAITDSDTALQQAIKNIASMRDHDQQAAAAKDLFRERTAAILPVIQSFDGDLPGLIDHLRDLGILMSKHDTDAADRLGDQMDTLSKQMRGAKIAIGTELMPVFLDMATRISGWLAANKGEFKAWGFAIADTLSGTIAELDKFKSWFDQHPELLAILVRGVNQLPIFRILNALRAEGEQNRLTGPVAPEDTALLRYQKQLGPQLDTTDPEAQKKAEAEAERARKEREAQLKQQLQDQVQYLQTVENANKEHIDGIEKQWETSYKNQQISAEAFHKSFFDLEEEYRKAGLAAIENEYARRRELAKGNATELKTLALEEEKEKETLVNASLARETAAEKLITEQKKKLTDEQLADAKEKLERQTSFFEAEADKRYAVAVEYAEKEGRTAEDLAKFKEFLDESTLEYRKAKLEEYLKSLTVGSKEYLDVENQIKILEQKLEEQRAKNYVEDKKRREEQIKSWSDYIQKIEEAADAEDEKNRKAGEYAQQQAEKQSVIAPGTLGGGIAGGLGIQLPSIFTEDGIGVLKSGAEMVKAVYADVKTFAGEAIGSMVDGLAQMGAAWISTGHFSAKAALQMMAATALSIAMQAVIKGIFEEAEAIAAAARFDFVSAGLHTAAAKVYFVTAAIAGAAGVGLGIAARYAGGGASGAAGSQGFQQQAGTATGSTVNQNPPPYSRGGPGVFGENTFFGQAFGQHMQHVGDAINNFTNKYSVVSSGQVLVAGIDQRPGVIGNAVHSDIQRNSSLGSNILKASGVKG